MGSVRSKVSAATFALGLVAGGCSLLLDMGGLEHGEPLDADVRSAPDARSSDGGEDSAAGVDADADEAGPTEAWHEAGAPARLYVFGGRRDDKTSPEVWMATIQPDGALGAWEPAPALPAPRQLARAVVGPDFVAVVAGQVGAYSGSIMVAPRSGDEISTWYTAAVSVEPRVRFGAAFHDGRLYVLGGTVSGSEDTGAVEAGPLGASSVGPLAALGALPAPRSRMAVANRGPLLYLIGGTEGGVVSADVSMARIQPDGTLSSPSAQPSLPTARNHAEAVVHESSLIVVGGIRPSVLADVLVFPIDDADGSLGAPSAATSLPEPRYHHALVTHGGFLYVLGGADENLAPTDTVYVAELTSAGGLASGWSTTTPLPAPLYYHTAAVSF